MAEVSAFAGFLRDRGDYAKLQNSARYYDHGYGWLPYEYVLSGLAVDWWSLISAQWIDTGNFG